MPDGDPKQPEFEFDVALSYAGCDREIAGAFARILKANGVRIFYDEDHRARMWGRNLFEELGVIYSERSRYCLVIVSREYCNRAYTTHERRMALDRMLRSRGEYILPIVTDDAWLDGLPRATAYFDLRQDSVEYIAEELIRKIRDGGDGIALPDPSKKIVPVSRDQTAELRWPPTRIDQALDFAWITLSKDAWGWKPGVEPFTPISTGHGEALEQEIQTFSGEIDGDPVFDIVILNRSAQPVLLVEVGIEVVEVGFTTYCFGGGVCAQHIELAETFYLELPDMWAYLADRGEPDRSRAPSGSADHYPAVTVKERASNRLPNPVLLPPGSPYRFELVLFDYQNLLPNHVKLRAWARTDRGEARSHQLALGYVIGGHYVGYARYCLLKQDSRERRIRYGAHQKWEQAGQPSGRDREFWLAAEQELHNQYAPDVSPRTRPHPA